MIKLHIIEKSPGDWQKFLYTLFYFGFELPDYSSDRMGTWVINEDRAELRSSFIQAFEAEDLNLQAFISVQSV